MRVFDLAHAYQAFQPPDFVPSRVEKNLTEIFLPLSRAMRKGLVRRGLQLQGWTIEAWLAAGGPIRSQAWEVLANLKRAVEEETIVLGASAYSHPILPLLSDEVIKRQIEEDLAAVRKYLGEPTWFWFPEGAADGRSLSILHEVAPDLVAVIPDGCLGKKQFSGFVRIEFEDGTEQQAIVCNTLLKDIFMNAEDYKVKPRYAPKELDWEAALRATHSGEDFKKLVAGINTSEDAVLARDLENAGSKYGLVEIEEGEREMREVEGLKEAEVEFGLPNEINWEDAPTMAVDEVRACCWEPRATKRDPYPYWVPARPPQPLQGVVRAWKEFVEVFNRSFRPDFPKQGLIVLASDVPWHFFGRPEWHPNPAHSVAFTQKVILPIVREMGISSLSEAAEKLLRAIRLGRTKENGA